jgi:hypothetical protein
MRYILIIVFIFSLSSVAREKEKIILTESSIGNMKIQKGMPISLFQISKNFPFYRVTQEIGQGDSPDFHMFKVSTYENEDLIYFISYINEQADYERGVVKLDEVMTCSAEVKDSFGVSPQMTIDKALSKRNELKFGAGHIDNYFGSGSIWYLFTVNNLHGTGVSKQVALQANPKIDCISWPYARWR